jgi:hypothetical protein
MGGVSHALLTLAAALAPLVTHGTEDNGDPAVVAIVDAAGTTGCSGTVIAPHLVLTAAHCVVPEISTGAHAVFGASVQAPSAAIPIVAVRVDPAFDPQTLDHDAAVFVLGATALATPVPLATTAPAAGSTVRVVGWGLTGPDAGDAGTKRAGTALVTALTPSTLSVAPDPAQPCLGDSGGAALANVAGTQVLVGITSHGDATCDQSAVFTRVDAETAAFIEPTEASLVDGTVPTGSRCLFPEQCAAGAPACVVAPDDANVSYCTQSCAANADCPIHMLCVSLGDSGSQCRYPVPTPGAMGAGCATDADCVDTSCSAGVCAAPCSPLQPTCPVGFSCASSDGIDYHCRLPPLSAATGSACALSISPANGDARWAVAVLGLAAWAGWRRRSRPVIR